MKHQCECCGAPLKPTTIGCAYCGNGYVYVSSRKVLFDTLFGDPKKQVSREDDFYVNYKVTFWDYLYNPVSIVVVGIVMVLVGAAMTVSPTPEPVKQTKTVAAPEEKPAQETEIERIRRENGIYQDANGSWMKKIGGNVYAFNVSTKQWNRWK